MEAGDFETSAEAYFDVLTMSPEEDLAVQAKLGLGLAYLRDEEYTAAADVFEGFLSDYPAGDEMPDAHVWLAEALVGAGEPLSATEHYRSYLAAGTVITPYVNEWLGDALYAGGAYNDAIEAFSAAIAEAPDRSFEVGMRERLALVHVALQDYAAAVAQYDAILDVARIRLYRARIGYQAAETSILGGEVEDGYDRHLEVVETYVHDYSAYAEYYPYLSLIELVEAGRPPDDFLRGVVDYYGGAYGPAVEALYRYIEANPDTYDPDAHWYAGLSFLEAGSPGLAALEFQTLIDAYPEHRRWGDSWMHLAEAYADTGDVETAVDTYTAFVETAPDHRLAPQALWEAAQLLERDGDLEAAAETYLDCHVQYPDSDDGPRALFRSGLASYRLEAYTDAAVAWDTLVHVYSDTAVLPAGLMWLGKVRLTHGNAEAAQPAFEEAVAADAEGHYGRRAAELMEDPTAVLIPSTRYGPVESTLAEQAEAEAWLAEWLELGSGANVGGLDPDLAADARLQSGLELWRLGFFEDGKWELEAVRQARTSNALDQYQLALLFRDVGLYRSSILCAARLVGLSPVDDPRDVPPFIARLAYPTYFEDLVLENADRSGLDPLLIFALIRQESLFESLATSSASAHGLMQVIPSTGAEIAAELDWPPDYETADLYRPYVSLRFGTYYLAQQRDRFGGRIDVALAGYNGGPLRAGGWLENAGDDPDLFLELITLSEPRIYVERIKEHLAFYQALYPE
jgi:soluble lytic murein transglycosylase